MSRTTDTHAEYGVLASLLRDAACLDRIAPLVTAADFSATTNRVLFEVLSSMILAGKAVDVLTVHSELIHRGIGAIDLETLNAISQSEITSRGAKRYAEAVRIASLERLLRSAIAQADEIVDGEGELSDRAEAATALFSAIAHRPSRRVPRHVSEVAINRVEHYTALHAGEIPAAWPTDIPALDANLSGGLRPGKVYVLAARPKVGKTSLAAQIAMFIASSLGGGFDMRARPSKRTTSADVIPERVPRFRGAAFLRRGAPCGGASPAIRAVSSHPICRRERSQPRACRRRQPRLKSVVLAPIVGARASAASIGRG